MVDQSRILRLPKKPGRRPISKRERKKRTKEDEGDEGGRLEGRVGGEK